MQVMVVFGNPQKGGFVHGCLEVIAENLEHRGVQVERLLLRERHIQDCVGCFTCLRTGRCALRDDMAQVCEAMARVDGLVVGCSVRNGSVSALYKRFFERITYPVGFGQDLNEKHVLALSAVGYMSGKRVTRKLLGLQDFGTYLTDHLFFRTGIPTGRTPEKVQGQLLRAVDRLEQAINEQWKLSLPKRALQELDRLIIWKTILSKRPEEFASARKAVEQSPLIRLVGRFTKAG